MKKLLLIFFLNQVCLNAESNTTLSKKETTLIDNYVENVSISDAVGQLFMVGINENIERYQQSPRIETLVNELGVGFVITDKSNYKISKKSFYYTKGVLDRDLFLDQSIRFHNYLQLTASKSNLHLPLLIASKNPNQVFKQGLDIPPSLLSLSATHDGDLIENIAILTALQLKNIGIDILLGPVLNNDKESSNSNTFGSNTQNIKIFSSHFIKGLNRAGIIIFLKNFPFNKINENLKKNYEIFKSDFKKNIELFKFFKKDVDGVMLSGSPLSPLKIKQSISLSSRFISNYVSDESESSINFNEKIVMTNDLTNKNPQNCSRIALKAFIAGNDILMFSNVDRNTATCSLQAIKNAKNKITKYIKDSNSQVRFKKSLKKIILLKAKITKQKGKSIENLLHSKKSIFEIKYRGSEVLTRSEYFLKNTPYKNAKELLSQTLNNIHISIHKNENIDISNLIEDSNTTILFMIGNKKLKKFKTLLSPLYDKFDFNTTDYHKYNRYTKYENYKKKSKTPNDAKNYLDFENYKSYLKNKATLKDNKNSKDEKDHYNYIIYTIHNISDVNAIDFIRWQKKDSLKKFILFVHCNPNILTEELINNTTVISSFTTHDLSYDTDIKIVNGGGKLKEYKYLPVKLSTQNDVEQTSLKIATSGSFDYSLIKEPTSKKLKNAQKKVEVLKNKIKTYNFFKDNHPITKE